MNLTATHLNYYRVCQRKLWLFASGMQMEHTSDIVKEGKLIGETTYTDRLERYTQIEINTPLTQKWQASVKIDYFDATNKVIHETKKSAKMEEAHLAQVRFYQYVMEKQGMAEVSAVLEYPKLRKTETILPLTDAEREAIENTIHEAIEIVTLKKCPAKIKKSFCQSCSYFDFCWVED
jgi:CRISPR-associated exonuclease Cas4